jgi:hypothetical protein
MTGKEIYTQTEFKQAASFQAGQVSVQRKIAGHGGGLGGRSAQWESSPNAPPPIPVPRVQPPALLPTVSSSPAARRPHLQNCDDRQYRT